MVVVAAVVAVEVVMVVMVMVVMVVKSHESRRLPRRHHHVQRTAPPTKSVHRHTAAPISCACHEKAALDHQNTSLLLRLPRK